MDSNSLRCDGFIEFDVWNARFQVHLGGRQRSISIPLMRGLSGSAGGRGGGGGGGGGHEPGGFPQWPGGGG